MLGAKGKTRPHQSAGEVIGNIDPTLPTPPPPPKKGCGTLGIILMVVVAVAAAAVVGPMVAQWAGAALGSSFAGAVVGGAAAGAAGSIASQGVGLLTGNIDKFQWANVSRATFTGGVTAGVGNVLSRLADAGRLGETLNTALKSGTAAAPNTSALGAAIKAGVGTAAAMGLKGNWNWRQIGIASIAAGAGQALGNAANQSQVLKDVFGGFNRTREVATQAIGAAAGGWAGAVVVGYNREKTRTVAGQAFISGLGAAIGSALAAPVAEAGAAWVREAMGPTGGNAGGLADTADGMPGASRARGYMPTSFAQDRAARLDAQDAQDRYGLGDLALRGNTRITYASGASGGAGPLAIAGFSGLGGSLGGFSAYDNGYGMFSPRPEPQLIGPYSPGAARSLTGIYDFRSGINSGGTWQASWNTYPNDVALWNPATGQPMLSPVVVTTSRDVGQAATDRLATQAQDQQRWREVQTAVNNGQRVDFAEVNRLGRLFNPNSAWAQVNPGQQLTSFGANVATLTAGIATGGLAFWGMRAMNVGMGLSVAGAGLTGTATTQGLDNVLYAKSGGTYGRKGVSWLEVGLSVAPGLGLMARGGINTFGNALSREISATLAPYTQAGRSVGGFGNNANAAEGLQAGVGGIKYSKVNPTDQMVSQELAMSCGPACARQYLLGRGVDVSEDVIRSAANFDPERGVTASNLAKAMNEVHPAGAYQGGGVAPEAFDALNAQGRWIARLRPDTGPHFVIVDGLDGAGNVLIRDPWGLTAPGPGVGLQGTLPTDAFMEYWRRGINQVVFGPGG